jgi:hypothetical protein
VVIDVDVGSEPISGEALVPGKQTQAFVGWAVLAEILEEARTDIPLHDDSSTAGGDGSQKPLDRRPSQ